MEIPEVREEAAGVVEAPMEVDPAFVPKQRVAVYMGPDQKLALLCTFLKNKAQFWSKEKKKRVVTQLLLIDIFKNLNRGHLLRNLAAYLASINLARHVGGSMLARTRDMIDARAFSTRLMLKILCITYEMLSLGDVDIAVPGTSGEPVKINCRVLPDTLCLFFDRLVLYRADPKLKITDSDYNSIQQFLNVLHEVLLVAWASLWLTLSAIENGERALTEESLQLQVAAFEAQMQATRETRMADLTHPYSCAMFEQCDELREGLVEAPFGLHYFPSLFDLPASKLCLLAPHVRLLVEKGDYKPMAKLFLWCFELTCYKAYTICLGTRPPTPEFGLGDLPPRQGAPTAAQVEALGAELQRVDEEVVEEEEEVAVDAEELKGCTSGKDAEETLYLLLGNIVRMVAGSILSMGQYLTPAEIERLKNAFLDTFTVAGYMEAVAQGLPVRAITARSSIKDSAKYQLLFPSSPPCWSSRSR